MGAIMNNVIEKILLLKWDPVDIADVVEAHDEYRTYAISIERMLNDGCTEQEIALALLQFERENMGFNGDVDRANRVAAMIMQSVKY